jgi:uncharacterized protein (TIGR00369 family)
MASPSNQLPHDLNHGFNGLIGLEIGDISTDRVTASLEVATIHQQPYGLVHGGLYCTMIEAVVSIGAAYWARQQGMVGAVGVSNTTDFLRPVRRGRLVVAATPIHQGRTQQLWQAVVTRDSDGKPVARGQVRLHNLEDPGVIGGLMPEEG